MNSIVGWSESCSVVSESLRPHGLYSSWDSPGKNTGLGSLSFSRGPSQPRDQTGVSCIAGGFFTNWAVRGALIWVEAAYYSGLFLVAQPSEHLPAMQETQETWVWSLGQEDDTWRKAWQPTPVFLPGESLGQRSLAGCSPWVAKSQTRLKRLSVCAHCVPSCTLCTWKRRPGNDSEPSAGGGALVPVPVSALFPLPHPTALRSPDVKTPLSDLPSWLRVFSLVSRLHIFAVTWRSVAPWGNGYTCCAWKLASVHTPVLAAVSWGL